MYEEGGGGGRGGDVAAIAAVSESEAPEEDEEAEGGRGTREKHTPSVRAGAARRGPQKKLYKKIKIKTNEMK